MKDRALAALQWVSITLALTCLIFAAVCDVARFPAREGLFGAALVFSAWAALVKLVRTLP